MAPRPSAPIRALRSAVIEGLREAANPDKAEPMRAYMKSKLPFWGVSRPDLKKICREVFKAHPIESEEQHDEAVRHLWHRAEHREERYAAIELTGSKGVAAFRTLSRLPLYEELIVDGAWWDFVDELAIHRIGPLLRTEFSKVAKVMRSWATDEDLWRRRTSIIVQVASKEQTDTKLLTYAIDKNLADRDFFIRKGIGWALRQYVYIDKDWVVDFVKKREDKLSGLSKREALKNVQKL